MKPNEALQRLEEITSGEGEREFAANAALRNLLICIRDEDLNADDRADAQDEATDEDFAALLDALKVLTSDPYSRDELSHLAIAHSLCPLHYVDWAICFDDGDLECSQIRAIFPHGHDT